MSEINLVDHSLLKNSNNKLLSIQAGLNGFSFCITSMPESKVAVFKFYPFVNAVLQEDTINKSVEILRKDELLQHPYPEVRIIYTSRQSTLIPDEFFNKNYLKKYLDFNQPVGELDEIHYNPLKMLGSQHVFAIPGYFSQSFANKYRNACFYNQGTSLINYAINSVTGDMELNVFVQLNKEFFDILVLFGTELLFYNTFLYVGPTDLVYFVLYVMKQLKIDTRKAGFYVCGELADQPDLSHALEKFIPQKNDIELPESVTRSPWLSGLPVNRFISLLNLSQCE